MAETFGNRLKHAFNSFRDRRDPVAPAETYRGGVVSSVRPDRTRLRVNAERTIIASIYTRLSIDVAGVKIEHCRVDDDDQYVETIKSGLNECLNVAANIDQQARHFRQDIPSTLFSEGTVAIVPVDTTLNPINSGNYDIKTMRVGRILDWYPTDYKVRLYNEKTGQHEDLVLPKTMVAVAENPFYSVMNEPNSTLQRLIRKLSLLDNVDEISSSGKLDIIIQLPYTIRSEERQKQADNRRAALQEQLSDSTYGIAYADATEKITQLNRSVENNLLEQVKYLKEELLAELGLTLEVLNGTADDTVMLNYYNRTIEPVMDAITEAMAAKFLTRTARTQGQTIRYFQTPFKMIPISLLGEITDVLSRNQVITPNEIRPALGLRPSKQPQANQLINSNMPLDKQVAGVGADGSPVGPEDSVDPADAEEAALDKEMAELGLS